MYSPYKYNVQSNFDLISHVSTLWVRVSKEMTWKLWHYVLTNWCKYLRTLHMASLSTDEKNKINKGQSFENFNWWDTRKLASTNSISQLNYMHLSELSYMEEKLLWSFIWICKNINSSRLEVQSQFFWIYPSIWKL